MNGYDSKQETDKNKSAYFGGQSENRHTGDPYNLSNSKASTAKQLDFINWKSRELPLLTYLRHIFFTYRRFILISDS